MLSRSVLSSSLRLHELQPTSLPCPWNFPGKESWSSLPSLPQGIFLTLGSKQLPPTSPALADGFLTTELPGKPCLIAINVQYLHQESAQMPSCCHPVANMHTSRNSPSFPCSIPMAHQWFIFREQEAMLVCHHFLNNIFPL